MSVLSAEFVVANVDVLVEARRRQDLTQDALAHRAGVSVPVISRAENGKLIRALSAWRLVRALGLELPDAFREPALEEQAS